MNDLCGLGFISHLTNDIRYLESVLWTSENTVLFCFLRMCFYVEEESGSSKSNFMKITPYCFHSFSWDLLIEY